MLNTLCIDYQMSNCYLSNPAITDNLVKFIYKCRMQLLGCNSLLHRYYPRVYPKSCPLCRNPYDTVSHVLNGCMNFQDMYSTRHDRIVSHIYHQLTTTNSDLIRAVASLTVPGGARVPLSSFFPQILIIFSYFSSNFSHFLPHFGSPGGSRPPGKALATPLDLIVFNNRIVNAAMFNSESEGLYGNLIHRKPDLIVIDKSEMNLFIYYLLHLL